MVKGATAPGILGDGGAAQGMRRNEGSLGVCSGASGRCVVLGWVAMAAVAEVSSGEQWWRWQEVWGIGKGRNGLRGGV